MEEWREVPGYPSYIVSNEGRVAKVLKGSKYKPDSKTGWDWYVAYSLQKDAGRPLHVHGHRLVAAAFIGLCPEGMVVNHKDGNKANNRLENLEYVSMSENRKHAFRELGRKAARGEDHWHTSFSNEQVDEMRKLYDQGHSIAHIARYFNGAYSTVQSIVRRLSRK